MSKPSPSDGKNQERMDEFIEGFDDCKDPIVKRTLAYFSELKANGRERFDDCNQLSLMILAGKVGERYGKIAPILKRYCMIKLQQGAKNWKLGDTSFKPQDEGEEYVPSFLE